MIFPCDWRLGDFACFFWEVIKLHSCVLHLEEALCIRLVYPPFSTSYETRKPIHLARCCLNNGNVVGASVTQIWCCGKVLTKFKIPKSLCWWLAAVQRGATLSALAPFILFLVPTVWDKTNVVTTDRYFCTRKAGSRVGIPWGDSYAEKFFLLEHLGHNE